MTARKPETQSYRALAREQAHLRRTIEAARVATELPRLTECIQSSKDIEVALQFGWRDRRPEVHGEVHAEVALPCQWCDAGLQHALSVQFRVWLAEDEAQAQAWMVEDRRVNNGRADDWVTVVAGALLSVPELIEDELILALPSRVCTAEVCEQRPSAQYGAATESDASGDEVEKADSPFAVLSRYEFKK